MKKIRRINYQTEKMSNILDDAVKKFYNRFDTSVNSHLHLQYTKINISNYKNQYTLNYR